MQINIATFLPWDTLCTIAKKHHAGIEIQQFCSIENLDSPDEALADVRSGLSHTEYHSMHFPFYSLNPAAFDPLVRDASMTRYRQAYEIAKKLAPRDVICHPGYFFPFAPDRYCCQRFGEFWRTFLMETDDTIEYHIENMFEPRWEYLYEFIASVDRPQVSACLDIGHINIHSPQTHAEWIQGLGNTIRYVHLHNNFGDNDSHFGLDKGTVPMREVLDLLLTHCPGAIWTIETSEVEQSFDWLTENGYL